MSTNGFEDLKANFTGKNGEAENGAHADLTDEQLGELHKEQLERYKIQDRPFPAPMAEEAFYGIAGDIVRIIEPTSEASREAIFAQLLVGLGNLIGRGPHRKQAGIHRINEFAVLVGETGFGRKGTSWEATQNLFNRISEGWISSRMRDGFQSGEAIIHAVRDPVFGLIPINKRKAGQADKAEKTLIDDGISDKRLLIFEEEFARVLIKATLPGNTLSSTLRKAWDAKKWLYVEGKIAPEQATAAHISMIGHITAAELLNCIAKVENENGFSNRILWIATQRTKELPFPTWINWSHYPQVLNHLGRVLETFGYPAEERELDWSEEAKDRWRDFYKSVQPTNQGIVGKIIARSQAHVLRLTMLLAVLDNSTLMESKHLRAAIAFWRYCERSATWAFGEKTGNRNADKIYWALQREPKGITRWDISANVFNRHATKSMLDQAFSDLTKAGLARFEMEQPKGNRPTERWFAVNGH